MPKSKAHHFYASTAFAWHVGATRDEAIFLALKQTRDTRGKREDAKAGEYVWSVRVDLPQSASYRIEYFMPVGVPMGKSEEGRYAIVGGKVVCIKAGAV